MSYLSATDYKGYIDEVDLEEITGQDPSVRKVAEDTASSLVSDHLNSRYDCEAIFEATGSDRHPSVVWACVCLSVYFLVQRLHPDAIPDHRREQYDRAMAWLKGVQERTINPLNLPLVDDGSKDDILYGGETKRDNRI